MKYNIKQLDVVLEVMTNSELFKDIISVSFETSLIRIISIEYINELKRTMSDGFTLKQLEDIRDIVTKGISIANGQLESKEDLDINDLARAATYPLGISLIQLYILNIIIKLLEINLYIPERNELVDLTEEDLFGSDLLHLVIKPELSLDDILSHYKTYEDLNNQYLAIAFLDSERIKQNINEHLSIRKETIMAVFNHGSGKKESMNYYFPTGMILIAGVGYFDKSVFKKVKE